MKKSVITAFLSVCGFILTINARNALSIDESIFECPQHWKWRCPSEDKCIVRSRQVCDGKPDCKEGEDEANCTSQLCSSNFFEDPKWKCPGTNVTKCISLEVVCDGKKDCDQGEDEGKLCTKRFCQAELNRFLCPKPEGNVCSQKDNICKNCKREFNCNEYNCTETFCAETFLNEKMACPDEKRCIGNKFACDGKLC